MSAFPAPIKVAPNSTRWRLSALERYEAAVCGEPEPPPRTSENERFLTVRQVAARYGTSTPSVWRWAAESRKAEAA